jgi:hypothetical protein
MKRTGISLRRFISSVLILTRLEIAGRALHKKENKVVGIIV